VSAFILKTTGPASSAFLRDGLHLTGARRRWVPWSKPFPGACCGDPPDRPIMKLRRRGDGQFVLGSRGPRRCIDVKLVGEETVPRTRRRHLIHFSNAPADGSDGRRIERNLRSAHTLWYEGRGSQNDHSVLEWHLYFFSQRVSGGSQHRKISQPNGGASTCLASASPSMHSRFSWFAEDGAARFRAGHASNGYRASSCLSARGSAIGCVPIKREKCSSAESTKLVDDVLTPCRARLRIEGQGTGIIEVADPPVHFGRHADQGRPGTIGRQ